MPDASWYAAWRADAFAELQRKNAAIDDRLGKFERFDYDIAKAALMFSNKGKVQLRCRIQVIGDTVTERGEWLWAWANSSLPEIATKAARETRQFGIEHGAAELTDAHVEDDEITERGWALAAVTMRVVHALGVYRAPTAKGFLFTAIMEIE